MPSRLTRFLLNLRIDALLHRYIAELRQRTSIGHARRLKRMAKLLRLQSSEQVRDGPGLTRQKSMKATHYVSGQDKVSCLGHAFQDECTLRLYMCQMLRLVPNASRAYDMLPWLSGQSNDEAGASSRRSKHMWQPNSTGPQTKPQPRLPRQHKRRRDPNTPPEKPCTPWLEV